jgi:hypothetical protein
MSRPSHPTRIPFVLSVLLLAFVVALPWGRGVHSADHRDAPLLSILTW